jgi:leucine dehydrogenase
VIVAIHSTRLGQAADGCRIWRYDDWRDGLDDARRADALRDAGDAVAGLSSRYAIGPDVGTTPHTAIGVVAALRAVCARRFGSPDLGKRRLAIAGLGSVGGHLARQLTEAGASLVVSDIEPRKAGLRQGTRRGLGRTRPSPHGGGVIQALSVGTAQRNAASAEEADGAEIARG